MTYCASCYCRKVYCRRCKDYHCHCSWSGCAQWKAKIVEHERTAASPPSEQEPT